MPFSTVSSALPLRGFKPAASFVSWWGSLPSLWERATISLLALVCLTVIFSTSIVQALVVVLFLVVVARLVFDRSFTFRRTPLDLPYLAFIAGRVVSIFFSQDFSESLPALYIEFFYYVVFFLVTQSIRRDETAAARLLVSVLVFAGVVAALIGILKVVLFQEPRGSSTTAGVYTLGGYLCAVLPLALISVRAGSSEWVRRLRWVVPLTICSGIVMTFDRLHWGGMAVILAVAAMISRGRKLLLLLYAALALFLILPSVRLRLERMVEYGDFTSGREVIWAGASGMLADHPIVGFGPRTFVNVFPLFDKLPVAGVGSWHNDYLQVYMDSGLIALLPLLWLVGVTYFHGWRLVRSPSLVTCERRLVLSLLVAVSVVFLVGGVLDTHVGIVFRTLLGLLALLASRVGDGRVSAVD